MNIFSKIVNQNPSTMLGKAMDNFKKEMGPMSFIIYMAPLIILSMIFIMNHPDTTQIPTIYVLLMGWYFVAMYLLDKIKTKNIVKEEIIKMVVCFPIYLSIFISYQIIKIFMVDKKKYPNVTEDKLPFHQRKYKLKKLKKKITQKRYLT